MKLLGNDGQGAGSIGGMRVTSLSQSCFHDSTEAGERKWYAVLYVVAQQERAEEEEEREELLALILTCNIG